MAGRFDIVIAIAPIAPPCFSDRLIWLSYLGSAAEAQRLDRVPGPLIFAAGEVVGFNHAFNFCDDCDRGHRLAMDREGRCEPDHLRRMLAAPAKLEEAEPA